MKRLNEVKAIAFDLDGTLVDSAPGLTLAAKLMLNELDLPLVNNEQVKSWIGNGIDVLIKRIFTSINAPESLFEQAKIIFTHHYNQVIQQETRLFPHVIATLEKLKESDYSMALVTNKPAEFLPGLLESLALTPYFSLILGGGDVIKLKPHPAPLYQVLATLGLYHQQLLFVGDSKNDILAAQHANCLTVGLTYGYNYGEPIATANPDYILDHFEDLLPLLAGNQTSYKN